MTSDHKLFHTQQKKKFLLPCLSTDGIELFTPTADQRFLASTPTDFLRTHFPVCLQSYHADITTNISEEDLLRRFLSPNATTIGNRVMILYGAAGSGKSELLRWLQLQISTQDASRAEVMSVNGPKVQDCIENI